MGVSVARPDRGWAASPTGEAAMNDDQIAAVQRTFADVAPIADQAAALFYGRLFAIAPQLRPLFKGDLDAQGRKLMAVLSVAVNGLRDLDSILPAVRALADRHVDYGVVLKDYAPVGEALLWTLREGLGEAFDAEVEAAWATVYATLSAAMIEAAYGHAAPAVSVLEVPVDEVDQPVPGEEPADVAEHEIEGAGGVVVGIVGGGVGGDHEVGGRPQR